MGNMIVFGAGASFGSDSSNVPPLGTALFDELVSSCPNTWGKIKSGLARLLKDDFERGMEQLSNQNPHSMAPLQRAMAEYFFRFTPSQNNLYLKLARKIRTSNWKGALVTLNYERLLELSLLKENLKPVTNEPQANKEVAICFPHGCCHLFVINVSGGAKGVKVPYQGITLTTDKVQVLHYLNKFQQRVHNDAFPPIMSYFVPQKNTVSGANFIQNQRQRFANLVSNSNKIAIIGLKVRLHDKHMWKPLAKTPARLTYCSGKNAAGEFKVWANQHRPSTSADIVFDGYFAEHFNDICGELGIG